MSTDGEFRELLVTIFSAEHLQIYGAAGAWLAMASLSASSDDWLSGAAAETAAEPGVGLIELAERMENSAATAQEIAVLAGRVAGQLQSAGDASARATEEALVLLFEYEETNGDPPGADVGMAANAFYERQLEEKRRLITQAARVLSDLGADFSKVTGGEVTAPGGGSGGGAGGGGSPPAPRVGTGRPARGGRSPPVRARARRWSRRPTAVRSVRAPIRTPACWAPTGAISRAGCRAPAPGSWSIRRPAGSSTR
ncbi:hypothetical protein [Streptomyces harbinensis]